MTVISFQPSTKPFKKIITLSDDSIVYSLGSRPVTIKDIIHLMSSIMFSKIYTQSTVQITLLENLEEKIVESQIKAFFFFQYQPLTYRTDSNSKNNVHFELLHSNSSSILELIEKNKKITKTINEIKDLIELPPELIYPESLTKYIVDFSKRYHLNVLKIYDKNDLVKEGFGGILSVGRGSHNPPKLAVLEWPGTSTSNNNSKPIILVGKGITYDSGGYSIKPDPYMKDMKRDKTGVCIVLGILGALSKLNYAHRVIAILPMAENVISSESYKPDEIIHSYSKKTVEVFNTDAEGRLILMDGLELAKKFNPKIIMDVATLTGVRTFCGQYGAIFSNNNEIAWKLQKNGEDVGDNFWVLPLSDEMLNDARNSKIANVKNDGFYCQSTTMMGAAFLATFVSDDVPWIHIDLGESESLYERYNRNNLNSTNSFLMLLEFLHKSL